ncbi:MAG: hypothetical protein ABIR26_02000 [Ramlibacter sp.]
MPVIIALLSTVLLLISMGFFMLGSLPLLVLKHDTPLDSSFIRGLFDVYYTAVMLTSTVAAASYGFAGWPTFSVGLCGVGVLAFLLRRTVISRMDQLRSTMTSTDKAAISRFRRLHIGGMLVNFVQLGSLAWALTFLRL